MELSDLIREWSSLGVGGIIAVILFHWYRKDVKSYTELWKSQTEILIAVVKDNTSAITSLIETTRAMHIRLDAIEKTRSYNRDRTTNINDDNLS